MPGTVNLWDYIETALYLNKVFYYCWITADVFPQRHDPIRIMEKTFEWMDNIFTLANRVESEKLFEMMKTKDALEVFDYVKSCCGLNI